MMRIRAKVSGLSPRQWAMVEAQPVEYDFRAWEVRAWKVRVCAQFEQATQGETRHLEMPAALFGELVTGLNRLGLADVSEHVTGPPPGRSAPTPFETNRADAPGALLDAIAEQEDQATRPEGADQ